ncbi:MAG: sulfite exporter TauE/SafE family protein [Pseudomonadales bacterium]
MQLELLSLAPLLGALLLSGAVIGVLAGLFGVGGGAISVPVFFDVFRIVGLVDEVAMPLAVGTSLAMIVPTSVLSACEHARKGTLEVAVLKAWLLPILSGVAIGAALARVAQPALFQGVFVVVAGLLATKLLFGMGNWQLSDTLPGRFAMSIYGVVLGLASALMGIGGGALSNLVLTAHGRSMIQAVSTSAGVGMLIAVPGTVGYMLAGWGKPGLPFDAIGYISMLTLVLTLPTALLTTKLGVRLAHSLTRETLTRLFGVFLLLVVLRFLVELFRLH